MSYKYSVRCARLAPSEDRKEATAGQDPAHVPADLRVRCSVHDHQLGGAELGILGAQEGTSTAFLERRSPWSMWTVRARRAASCRPSHRLAAPPDLRDAFEAAELLPECIVLLEPVDSQLSPASGRSSSPCKWHGSSERRLAPGRVSGARRGLLMGGGLCLGRAAGFFGCAAVASVVVAPLALASTHSPGPAGAASWTV